MIARIELSFKIEVVCAHASVFFKNLNFSKSQETENVLPLDFSRIYLFICIKIFLQNLGKKKKTLSFPRLPPATAH